jgi:hypothetical protein
MFVVIAVVALAMCLEVSPAGRLTGTEILFVLAAPFCLRRLIQLGSAERWFYVMVGLWLFGTVFADVYRDTAMSDLVKGWAAILFFLVNFTMVRALVGSDLTSLRQLIFFLYVASALREMMGIPPELASEVTGEPWKFGYGQLLVVSAALLSARLIQHPPARLVGFSLPYIAGVASLVLDARNLAGVTMLSALASHATALRHRPPSKATIVLLALGLAATGGGVLAAYHYAAGQRYLGERAYDKYKMQSEGNLNLLLSGRAEWLASPQAVMDSPIVGHGSWARDKKYVDMMESRLSQAGLYAQAELETSDLIPTHSYLMQAWVESGILGALFWFWAIAITIRGLYGAVKRPSPYNAFYFFIGFSFLWDVLFSPFRGEARVVVATRIYLMLLLAANSDRNETESLRGSEEPATDQQRFANLMR